MEISMAAIDRFSMIPGARSAPKKVEEADKKKSRAAAAPTEAPKPEAAPAKNIGPAIRIARVDESLVLIFPPERWDLDVAAALGKKDWESILQGGDDFSGQDKDTIYEHGAEFVAPVEFLSEVFVDGKPLNKAEFERSATRVGNAQTLEVHFPRYGAVLLFARDDGARFVSSAIQKPEEILALVP
jgi:hypothetical protein